MKCLWTLLLIVIGLGGVLHGATAVDASPQHFRIDQIVEDDWGKLVTVYDQPTYQRFTFESDTQVTILHVGLVWDNKEGTYRPNIRQVIHLMKKQKSRYLPEAEDLPSR